LKAMAGRDQRLADTLSAFIKRQQDSLFSHRRESAEGRVLLAITQLHQEGLTMTADAISQRVNELDEDADMSARRVGWIARSLGLTKSRIPRDGRHVVNWDEALISRLASQHGIHLTPYIPQEKTSPTSPLSP